MALQIIGAGLSRTGTLSMKAALEYLGFAPCYHGAEMALPRAGCNEGHLDAWHAYCCEGAPVDWRELFRHYRASVDVPGCLHYRELMQAFPEARVVLTTRDPDDWFDSWQALWQAIADANDPARIVRYHRFLPVLHALLEHHFDGKIERASNIAAYQRHVDAVRRDVPADRLLEFRVSEGWTPLCGFLGVDVPDVPFPRLNDRRMTRDLLTTALWTHEPLQL
ncbi:sulfotransferase family protein [Lysobacter yangpyeongensis]|uniref:Sulfotransferase family protein n=1 Tax=Lysobacter yangpyeongensis TaxID=346182 RepID=A0ABW0SME8_9GAMM